MEIVINIFKTFIFVSFLYYSLKNMRSKDTKNIYHAQMFSFGLLFVIAAIEPYDIVRTIIQSTIGIYLSSKHGMCLMEANRTRKAIINGK